MRTRGDVNYTALWILYAATPLARIEIIGAGLLADREVIPQAMKLNPALFATVYTDLLNTKKTARQVQSALDTIDAYLAERATTIFAPVLDHLREVGEARSCTEIEAHFSKTYGVEQRDHRLRVPGGSGADRQGVDRDPTHEAKQHRRPGARVLCVGRWLNKRAHASQLSTTNSGSRAARLHLDRQMCLPRARSLSDIQPHEPRRRGSILEVHRFAGTCEQVCGARRLQVARQLRAVLGERTPVDDRVVARERQANVPIGHDVNEPQAISLASR